MERCDAVLFVGAFVGLTIGVRSSRSTGKDAQSSNRAAEAPMAVVIWVVAFGIGDGVVPPAMVCRYLVELTLGLFVRCVVDFEGVDVAEVPLDFQDHGLFLSPVGRGGSAGG